jgi:hypothetical protein
MSIETTEALFNVLMIFVLAVAAVLAVIDVIKGRD